MKTKLFSSPLLPLVGLSLIGGGCGLVLGLNDYTAGAATQCALGQVQQCNTDQKGECRKGTQTCLSDRSGYDTCQPIHVPTTVDDCTNMADTTCDGVVTCPCTADDVITCTTDQKGACAAGTATCKADESGYGACAANVTPTAKDDCVNQLDTTCDGNLDCPDATCSPACVPPTGGKTACVGAACAPTCDVSGQQVCGTACTDTNTDKQNCGKCGTACEGYQYCTAGKCSPNYELTWVLPVTDQTSGGWPTARVPAAAVAPNGDVVVEIVPGGNSVRFSPPTGPFVGVYGSTGFARYSPSGVLNWGRDFSPVVTSDGADNFSPMALASNGDILVTYYKNDPPPPPGPARQTGSYRFGRLDGNNPQVLWETAYAYSYTADRIIPRPAKGDFIAMRRSGYADTDFVLRVVDGSTAPTTIAQSFSDGAALAPDGLTMWMWGSGTGSPAQLNPWSSNTWTVQVNPSQVGMFSADVYIIGAREDGTSIGPWITEGDWQPEFSVAVNAMGDLIIGASAIGPVAINGGQPIIVGTAFNHPLPALIKLNGTTGNIAWRTELPSGFNKVVMAPGGRVVVLSSPLLDSSYNVDFEAPNTLGIYDESNGHLLTSFTTGKYVEQVAVGAKDIFLVGLVDAATDFNPGAATDTQGAAPGVFISRFSF